MKTPFQIWLGTMHFKSRFRARFFIFSILCLGLIGLTILPWLDPLVPGGAPVVQLFLEGVWFCLMVFGVWNHRISYREKYGELAYQKIVRHFFFFAVIIMFIGLLRPLHVKSAEVFWIPVWFRILIGLYFLIAGILLYRKGVLSLGIDRVLFVYTIFQERGKQIQSKLYQFLRHPLYAAMIHVSVGLALMAGKVDGSWCALIFILKLILWSKIEEKELITRFGTSYLEYKKDVPAFIPKLKRVGAFWKTLF